MSRMVKDHERLAERVERTIRSVLEILRERLAEIYASLLEEGEALPDPVFALELDLRLLSERVRGLRGAHRDYAGGRIERKALADQRDQLAAKLHDRLAGLRKSIDGEYGTGGSATVLGLQGRTRRKYEPLLEQTKAVLAHLAALSELPESRHDPASEIEPFDADRWRGRIESPYDQLREAARAVVFAQERVVQLRTDRNRAAVASEIARRHVVNSAVSYCKLAGRDDLAERVRRFSRPRGRPGPKKARKLKADGE